MSKKAKISNKQVDAICQKMSDQLKPPTGAENPSAAPQTTGSQSKRGIFFWGAASGVALMLAAPLLRPAARSAVKAGLRLGRQAQEFGSSIKEEFEDISAEARAELNRESSGNNPHSGQA